MAIRFAEGPIYFPPKNGNQNTHSFGILAISRMGVGETPDGEVFGDVSVNPLLGSFSQDVTHSLVQCRLPLPASIRVDGRKKLGVKRYKDATACLIGRW